MHPWERIWAQLTPEERRLGAEAYLAQCEKIPDAVRSANEFLAVAHKTSPRAVAGWSPDRRADRLARAPLDTLFIGVLVKSFFVKHRAEMLARFLDVAEIPNLNGTVDGRTSTVPRSVECLVAAVRTISAEFPPRDAVLYLDALELDALGPWTHLAQARALARQERAAADAAAPGVVAKESPAMANTPPAPTPAPTPDPGPRRPPPLPASSGPKLGSMPMFHVETPESLLADPESLTALDDLLRDAAVATASGVPGALSFDRLRAIAEEVVTLGTGRQRSWFHPGFVDALEGKAVELPRASDRQRGWYLSGAAHGLLHRGDGAALAALLERNPADARRILGERHEACGITVGLLFEALCGHERRAQAIEALAPGAVMRGGESFQVRLLEEARTLLAASRPADAMPILTLLTDALDTILRRKGRARPGLAEDVAIARALALRLHGNFDVARRTLEPLRLSADPSVAARAGADLGLVECRVRSLSEVRLPARADDLGATAQWLAPGRTAFESGSADENRQRAQPDFCLGVLRLCEGRVEEARPPLERATASIAAGNEVPEGFGVLSRARLCLALALAESLDAGRATEAVENLVLAARELPEEAHPYVLARALAALAASSPAAAAEATRRLHASMGDRLLDAALEAGILPSHEELRETLAARCEDPRRSRALRGPDAQALLRDALAAADVARAERALGVLEELADDPEGRARLRTILEDRSRFDPAWDAEEASFARVRLLEADGRYEEAARLLCAAGHEILSRDPERGLATVADLFDRIDGYGIARPDAALEARCAALRRGSAPPVPATVEPQGSVYVIGGNEVQARYEGWLREEVARRWPRVSLQFDYTGWSGNWGREVPAIENRIAAADAVVVMRFIRTMLGRTVRATCGRHGKPWVACTGHGRDSLLRAIERAVSLAPGQRA